MQTTVRISVAALAAFGLATAPTTGAPAFASGCCTSADNWATFSCVDDTYFATMITKDKSGRKVTTKSTHERHTEVTDTHRIMTTTVSISRTVGKSTRTSKKTSVVKKKRLPMPATFDISKLEKQVFDLTNAERKSASLIPLKPSAPVSAVARDWSRTMAKTGNYEHRPNFTWMKKVNARRAGENIHNPVIYDNYDLATIAVEDWMFSPGHRRNILNKSFTHLGVGVARAKDGSFYLTQNFSG